MKNFKQLLYVSYEFQGLFKHFVRKGDIFFQGIPFLDFLPLGVQALRAPGANPVLFLFNMWMII